MSTRARNLARIANGEALSVNAANNVGVGSTVPEKKLDVEGNVDIGTTIKMDAPTGIITATEYYGDGSNLDNISAAGLGTAIDKSSNYGLQSIYYTDTTLGVGDTITVDVPSSSRVAYTQYSEIQVDGDADLIVAEGDDFIPDILGLTTEGVLPLPGTGGRIRADFFTNRSGAGSPEFQAGLRITGVTTSTSFSGPLIGDVTGNLTGNVTGNAGTANTATDAEGLIGTPDITVRNIIGVGMTLTGELTYEDVTNVDSIGIITAQSGIKVGAGQSIGPVSGTITYYGDGSKLSGLAVGLGTTVFTATANSIITLNLTESQHHDITLTAGITTITCSGGELGQSHSVILTQPTSGIATVGFSTYFLFPSGSVPAMSEGGGKIDLLSFVAKQVGAGGTQLLASAGLNYQ